MDFAAHKVPVFKEEKSNEFVIWGYDREDRTWHNKYGDYLIWLYNSSAKNNAIINGKNTYIVGEGWGVKFSTEHKMQELNAKLMANSFIAELEDSKITRDLSLDRVIFGGFAAQMIPNKNSEGGMAHHVDFSRIRVKKKEYNLKGEVKPRVFGYTEDWNRKPEDNKDYQEFEEFSWDWSAVDKSKNYLVYYKDYRPNLGDYPLPEYIGAIPYISADYEIGNWTYNQVKAGFSAGVLVNFYGGEPSDPQKAKIEQRWKDTKHGSDKAGDPIMSFNEDKDSGVEVTPLSANGQDDRFINLNEQIRTEIYTGHNFSPILAGLPDNQGLQPSNDQIHQANELMQNTYISKQQAVLEDFINSLADLNGIRGDFFIKRMPSLQDKMTDLEAKEILTVDERRELRGLAPLTPKQTIETKTTFKKETDDKLIKAFENCGTSDEELIILDSRELFADNIEDATRQGDKFKFESKKANALLGVLNANDNLSKSELSDLTGLKITELDSLIAELEEDGLVDKKGIPTEKGKQAQQQIFVVYKYGLRNELKGQKEVLSTTRDFCSKLVSMSKSRSWTVADINAMNNDQGLDVFSSRGGFWHDPKTEITHNYCRHIWIQSLVTRR